MIYYDDDDIWYYIVLDEECMMMTNCEITYFVIRKQCNDLHYIQGNIKYENTKCYSMNEQDGYTFDDNSVSLWM